MPRPRPSSIAAALLLLVAAAPLHAREAAPTLARLAPGTTFAGFRAEAVYLDDADRAMGARFVHASSGFVLDVLQIQSVPQAFLWVNTLPTSDQGEPHTQEHLLLGKGRTGKAVATQEPMSLAESSAFTSQWRTCYHFFTDAGVDVFYQQFAERLNALMHPDYTDEEIRREVRNFGVTEDPGDHTLRLEEKGTVYNEMVGSTANPAYALYHQLGIDLYGTEHPIAWVSGGTPAGIRTMTTDDIRRFHARNYVLDNMGMIASVPKEAPLAQVLTRMGAVLDSLAGAAGAPRPARASTVPAFPPPRGSAPGTVTVVEYPEENPDKPAAVALAWAPVRSLDAESRTLLTLFLDAVAGDATTNLYKRFVDSRTKTLDVGAQGVFASVGNDPGAPVIIGLDQVAATHLNRGDAAAIRDQVLDELRRIAAFADGSAELREFNARIRSRLVAARRRAMKFVNSPPNFGFRGTGTEWMDQLLVLEGANTFRRSVTLKPEFAAIERLLARPGNPWRRALADWKLLDTPYAVAVHPSPALVTQLERERVGRIADEVARLRAAYGVKSDADAIRRYRAAYDSATAALDGAAGDAVPARLVDALPLTLDDPLRYEARSLPGGVPYVRTTFDNMTSATTGMAFRLDGVRDDQLVHLALLPELLTQVGVVENGRRVPYEEMRERLRNEVLSLEAAFGVNDKVERYELVLRGAGNDAAEAVRAVAWMRLVALHPDWSPDNLPRIRDLVDQTLARLRDTRRGPDEYWVGDVGDAYRRQDSALFLATRSFLTQTNSALRLRWQLMDGAAPDRGAAADVLERLTQPADATRAALTRLAAALQADSTAAASPDPVVTALPALAPGARKLVGEAGKDLAQSLPDLPDETLAADWAYLCRQMRRDLQLTPARALRELEAVRAEVLRSGNVRVFAIGATPTLARLEPPVRATLAALGAGKSTPAARVRRPLVLERLEGRAPDARQARFVGLLNPNSQGGVIMNSGPFVGYDDTDEESILRYLAGNLYAGGGAHSMFMQTWGAGLAYSNGIGSSPEAGRLYYYAERTPELPQTLTFVIEQLRHAKLDPTLTDYAVSLAFGSRAAQGYERRGEAMAANLADGVTPERVAAFRKAVLAVRRRPQLANALFDRMPAAYARVLPGFDAKAVPTPGTIEFVIGPEKQFGAYETYLRSAVGPGTRLHRLSPRDFWLPMAEPASDAAR